jgi:hypothetical protein
MQRASFQAQAAAVLRSNASLQLRSKLTNACLLLLPLAFCGLLFGLQVGGQVAACCYCCCCPVTTPPPSDRQHLCAALREHRAS